MLLFSVPPKAPVPTPPRRYVLSVLSAQTVLYRILLSQVRTIAHRVILPFRKRQLHNAFRLFTVARLPSSWDGLDSGRAKMNILYSLCLVGDQPMTQEEILKCQRIAKK